jgi:hypothetical protein
MTSTPTTTTKRSREEDEDVAPPAKKKSNVNVDTMKLTRPQQKACVLYALHCVRSDTTLVSIASRIGLNRDYTNTLVQECLDDKSLKAYVKEGLNGRRINYFGVLDLDSNVHKIRERIGSPDICQKISNKYYVKCKRDHAI